MTQDFDLQLDGESVRVISAELITTFDTPNDGFSALIGVDRLNNPNLYNKIKPYKATDVTVNLNNTLMLTGTLTKTKSIKKENGRTYNISGWSKTFNFVDSDLSPPYEYRNYDINELITDVAKSTATNVELSQNPGGKFPRVTANSQQSGYDFMASLAIQRSHVISNTPEGKLILQQANTTQQTVGTIDEDSPNSLLIKEFNAEYDIRKRFKTYKVRSQTPFGRSEAVATDKNIVLPRNKNINANDIIKGEAKEIAEYNKNIALIKTLTQNIPVVGWNAPDGSFLKSGTMITIKSETYFVPDGFTYFIRAIKYIYSNDEKTVILSLIPKEVYTNEPIIEPWFENSNLDAIGF